VKTISRAQKGAIVIITAIAISIVVVSAAAMVSQDAQTSGFETVGTTRLSFHYGVFFPGLHDIYQAPPSMQTDKWVPSCKTGCNGIWFYADPVTLIMTLGLNWLACQGWNQTTACSIAGVSGQSFPKKDAVYFDASTSSTTPTVGDLATSGPCSIFGPIWGTTEAITTYKAGSGGTWVAIKSTKILTAPTTETNTQVACYYFANSNALLFAEASFTPISLNTGQQLNYTFIANMTQG
jgi:hypothetical protein